MPLLIVVAALIVIGVVWRGRATRRLTIEESVDRYRRTLSAVHEAATRSRAGEATTAPSTATTNRPTPTFTARRASSRAPMSRRTIAVSIGVVAVIVVIASIVASTRGATGHPRTVAPTTTRPPATRPSTTTTVAAPTTTRPLIAASDTTGASFVVGKASYTLVLAAAASPCWVDARDGGGSSLFTGLLAAGASQSITATNALVRLGNPGTITVTVDGTRVPFTTHNGAPLTLHFQGLA